MATCGKTNWYKMRLAVDHYSIRAGAGLARQLPCQLWSNWMGHHRKHCHHDRHRNHHRHRHHRHYHHRNHHRYHFAKITMQSIKVGRAVGESKKLKLGSKPRLRSIPALPEIANEEVSAKVSLENIFCKKNKSCGKYFWKYRLGSNSRLGFDQSWLRRKSGSLLEIQIYKFTNARLHENCKKMIQNTFFPTNGNQK